SWLHPNADKSSNGNTPYNPNTPISTGLGPASTWTTDFNPLYESGIGQITFSHFFNPWPWSPAQPSPRIQNFADWMEAEEITSSDNYTFDLIEPRSMSTGPGQYSEVFVWATNTNG